MKKLGFLTDTLIGFVILWLINLVIFKHNPGFIGVTLHPYLFLILIITLKYGYTKGLSAILGSTFIYICCAYLKFHDFNTIFKLEYFNPVIGFIVLGTLSGILIDNQKKRERDMHESIENLENVINRFQEDKQNLDRQSEELSQRLIFEKSTFSVLYNSAKKLSTHNIHDLFKSVLELIKEIINPQACALYFIEGQKLVLKESIGSLKRNEIEIDQTLLTAIIKDKKVISIKDAVNQKGAGVFEKHGVFIFGPLCMGSNGPVTGIIALSGISFMKYNSTNIRIFTLICDWASIALKNASDFRDSAGGSPEAIEEKFKNSFLNLYKYGTDAKEIIDSTAKQLKN
ncbi:MAG: hypothetical protein A2252_02880 [Elusimicrobia bacterium RIFOXYA2_FULL_39_19]|nr:MAG: hypothetical protein A2252_02880 [Elusimicrobia bacterium RIFOXYA2_FULL_39_19]